MKDREALSQILLCALDDVPNPGARGFQLNLAGEEVELFIVRKGDKIFGYFNRCPHTGVNLDWLPDKFLDAAAKVIVCATHGALFDIETGRCLEGPCAGDRLTPVSLEIRRGRIFLLDAG